jgi:hypothetical protein
MAIPAFAADAPSVAARSPPAPARLMTRNWKATFAARLQPEYDGGGTRQLLRRLTMVIHAGAIEKVFH